MGCKAFNSGVKAFILALLLLLTEAVVAAEVNVAAELFMRDGQLKSHPVRVFVTYDITEAMKPRLILLGSHAISREDPNEGKLIEPKVVARHQRSKQKVEDEPIYLTGTLLLFDLRDYPIPTYKGMMRVLPVLTWAEESDSDQEKRILVGPQEINVGNIGPVALWTVVMLGLLIGTIVLVARGSTGKAIYLLCSSSGRLSLAHTQVTLWTVGVGTMVAAYGFLRFEVPDIPESLVALMGLSFATGGISEYRGRRPDAGSRAEPAEVAKPADRQKPRLFHLVSEAKSGGEEELSLARAQMLFWTGITLTLFIVKSVLDGVLWEVPWEMVAFMGMSQLGYLGPKWMPK